MKDKSMDDVAIETSPPVLGWHIRLKDIGERKSFSFDASDEQRVALAAALEVSEVQRLHVELTARVADGARVHVHGTLAADVTQACIVTLDPVPDKISDDVRLVFCPSSTFGARPQELEVSPFDDDTPEPYDGDRIEIGQLVFEILASNLNPYPRVDNAELERTVAGSADDEAEAAAVAAGGNPFAELQKLKDEES